MAADSRYHAEAYGFLRDALEQALKKRRKATSERSSHVSAAELLEAFRAHAVREFGPMAVTVLGYWGVRDCGDVGNMVFNLIQAGVFGKNEEDSIEEFRRGFDFHEVFVSPFLPKGKKSSAGRGLVVGP